MSQDYPTLALDDLVHLMSPSPAPQNVDDPELPPRTNSTSPEPILDSDIQQIRNKVLQLAQSPYENPKLTPREKELADMVLRLTTVVRPDSEQLVRQADVISALTEQRNLLVRQAEEQRLRWNSEKDGWARMAEALIVQQTKNRSHSDEDYERLPAVEADNKTLRQRLTETQTRLQILESELTRLRPLLLMQPLISSSSMPPPTPKSKSQHPRKRKKDPPTTEDEDHPPSDDEPPLPAESQDTPTPASHAQATPRTKSRKSEAPNPFTTTTHKRRSSQKTVSRGLSADARVEHLLLASRKLGKQRAGLMSGMMHQFEERERERRREESAVTVVASTPKTPKRVAQTTTTTTTGYPREGGYVYMSGQMRAGPGMHPVPLFIPAYQHHLLQTPSSSTTAPSVASPAQPSAQKQKQKQDARTNNPPTPLDSLLSAARSMMREDVDVDGDEDEEVDVVGDGEPMTGTRRARPRDVLDSPVPKRRKVSGRGDKLTALQFPSVSSEVVAGPSKQGTTSTGVGRVRSALDVLADQAAAFSSQEQASVASQSQPAAQRKGKGKEKERVDVLESVAAPLKPRERQKSRRKEADTGADACASSARATSRSRTPRSDVGETTMASTHVTSSQPEGSTLEAPNDPGGGTSGTSSHPTSSQSVEQQSVPGIQSSPTSTLEVPSTPSTRDSQVDESGETTPRPSSATPRAHVTQSEGTSQTNHVFQSQTDIPPNPIQQRERAPSVPATESRGESPSVTQPRQRAETAPAAPAKNKDLARVAGQDGSAAAPAPGKRQRSPYVKWSKEEDDLLAQAVAKYGQKWDLVQKALPSRGYHQVRQRWLRKLGVFDSKPDLSSFQTAANTFGHPHVPGFQVGHGPAHGLGNGSGLGNGNGVGNGNARGEGMGTGTGAGMGVVEPRPNPKLGLAPLSSERAFSAVWRGERTGGGMGMGE